eukprot:TRINITY_DN5636_c0_g1_i2.p1 TRINITY_DN5636_c0_g1~~TRINITY_DN5636_c0_g1_i2.p1  ORF type:complete len:225 (+),score=30.51 TRINITY_DN5636_c0_g1_i2:145-819(+)
MAKQFELSFETFEMLTQTDPVPVIVIDLRAQADSKDLILPSSTLVVKLTEFDKAKLPSDGCVCVVYDGAAPAHDLLKDTPALYYNINTEPNQNAAEELVYKDCETITEEGDSNVVLDVRRHDEVSHFGKLPNAVHLPLHEFVRQLTIGEHGPELLKVLTSGKPVVVGCRTNRRSRFATRCLLEYGLPDVKYIDKGACGCSKLPSNLMRCYPSYEITDPVPKPNI